jgi:hypothetical protein
MVYRAVNHVTITRMSELSLAPTLVAKINEYFFPNSSLAFRKIISGELLTKQAIRKITTAGM